MHLIWGLLMIAAGLFMLVCGTTRSEFIIYRLMVARSRILWNPFHGFDGNCVSDAKDIPVEIDEVTLSSSQ